MIIRNEDIKELIAEIPEGHRHLRTTIKLQDGTELVFSASADSLGRTGSRGREHCEGLYQGQDAPINKKNRIKGQNPYREKRGICRVAISGRRRGRLVKIRL